MEKRIAIPGLELCTHAARIAAHTLSWSVDLQSTHDQWPLANPSPPAQAALHPQHSKVQTVTGEKPP